VAGELGCALVPSASIIPLFPISEQSHVRKSIDTPWLLCYSVMQE
jgi:hypothetical protein